MDGMRVARPLSLRRALTERGAKGKQQTNQL